LASLPSSLAPIVGPPATLYTSSFTTLSPSSPLLLLGNYTTGGLFRNSLDCAPPPSNIKAKRPRCSISVVTTPPHGNNSSQQLELLAPLIFMVVYPGFLPFLPMTANPKSFPRSINSLPISPTYTLSQRIDCASYLFIPGLSATAPMFVDHLPSSVCHTLFFCTDPTTLTLTNQTFHNNNIPPHLLAALSALPYQRAGSIQLNESPASKPAMKNLRRHWPR
jgi:hypothetical protein